MHFFKPCLRVVAVGLGFGAFSLLVLAQDLPKLTLANTYQLGVNLERYLVSEKYDGVRAYWDGKQLLARSGNVIQAPAEFIQPLPKHLALDGELWFGREQFGRSAALIHRLPSHPSYLAEWQAVKYMVFDAPHTEGDFKQRLAVLHGLNIKHAQVIIAPQWTVSDHATLQRQLKEYTAAGAEGLMLRLVSAPYNAKRSADLLKVKLWQDAEARVKAWLPGKGKYQGMMGSLLVVLDDGREMKIGTGFKDAERTSPPAIGSRITFKYQGETSTGLPRFPVYWRKRLPE